MDESKQGEKGKEIGTLLKTQKLSPEK